MSNPGQLAAIEYEAESVFGEDVTTFATLRVPVINPVDPSAIVHSKIDSQRTQQYLQGGSQWIPTTKGGSFKTKMYLAGHGSTMVGSPALAAYETLLGFVTGNVAFSAAASTTLTGGTASVPVTTASGTFSAGGFCRIGARADARGGGQFYGITTHITTSLTLLNAMINAPTNGDVLYPVTQLYHSELPTSAGVTGLRFRFLTANLGYECHGCYPMSYTIAGLNPGEVPTIEVTWGVSWWRYTTATFPSSVATNAFNPGPIAAGSLHVQDVGTVTRNARTFRNFAIDVSLGIVPLPGPGGVDQFQSNVGARRTPSTFKASWVEDADTATTSPVLPGYGTGTTSKVVCWTGSTADGSALGFLMRSVCISNIPIQMIDTQLNRLKIDGYAYTGAVTTNDLTLTSFLIGLA